MAHLTHERPRYAIEQPSHACGADSILEGLHHPLVARRLETHFGEVNRVRDACYEAGWDTAHPEGVGLVLALGRRDGGIACP